MQQTTTMRSPRAVLQQSRDDAFNVSNEDHPAHEIFRKCLGTHTLKIVVEEDLQTMATLKHVQGLVAFLATVFNEGQILSQGRGIAVLNPTNRYVGKAIHGALNSSITDAIIRGTKVMDMLIGDVPVERVPATDKQLDYIRELFRQLPNQGERLRWEGKLDRISKDEASSLIASMKK